MSDNDKPAQEVAKEQGTRVWNQWDDEVAADLQAEFGEGIDENAEATPTVAEPVPVAPEVASAPQRRIRGDYDEATVAQLRSEASLRKLDVRPKARKAELVRILLHSDRQ